MEKNIVRYFMDRGYLLSPDTGGLFSNIDKKIFLSKLNERIKHPPVILNKDIYLIISELGGFIDLNWNEFEKALVEHEKGRNDEEYHSFLDILMYNLSDEKRIALNSLIEEIKEPSSIILEEEPDDNSNVVVLRSYNLESKKRDVPSFVHYFRNRYESIKKILLGRRELQDSISISRIKNKKKGELSGFIGLVSKKDITKNGHIFLTLEDNTGSIKVFISKEREIYSQAKEVNLDEVIGMIVVSSADFFICSEIFLPDIPNNLPIKKCDDDVYMAITSDTHFGIKQFLEKEFNNFIDWLRGEYGTDEQKKIASKIKYLFIVGDLVEGVGIYPGQENDLIIKDIYKQYEAAYEYFKKIPKNIKIIICTGNHDATRLSEPQPLFDKDLASPLYNLDNLILVSNPSYVNVSSTHDFEGFNVLLYHGVSLPYYADCVERIRQAGGLKRIDLVMHYLLQRRHLAPAHGSTLYLPDDDFLVIDKIPDFFITGHTHNVNLSIYKNITCINSSCWVTQTEDQERRGIVPEPGRVVIVNLKDRSTKIINFENEKQTN